MIRGVLWLEREQKNGNGGQLHQQREGLSRPLDILIDVDEETSTAAQESVCFVGSSE